MSSLPNLDRDEKSSRPPENDNAFGASPRVRQARSELLAKITDFAMRHNLEINSMNLATICGALSGSNSELAEAFSQREISGEPIDQRWLDEIIRQDPEISSRVGELEKLMDQLEYTLIRFAQTNQSARTETGDFRGALDAEVNTLADASETMSHPREFLRVVDLSRSVIERISQVEAAMEKSQSETDQLRANLAKARMEADIDHLTRLPNRRAFERRLITAAERARTRGEPLCVGFCDVDHFKKINDRHGHDAGDRVLCAIASLLSENADDQCFVARHGGEEFVVLFYGLDKDAAFKKMDLIRRAQAAKLMMNRESGRPFGKVTFSCGIAQVKDEADARLALGRADKALYEAKEAGRNRVIAV